MKWGLKSFNLQFVENLDDASIFDIINVPSSNHFVILNVQNTDKVITFSGHNQVRADKDLNNLTFDKLHYFAFKIVI